MDFFTGIDLVEVERIEESLSHERFVQRVYSEKEQALLLSKQGRSKAQTAAANFAAKEAFSKSLGTGVIGFSLNEVSILRDEKGCPFIELAGKALEIAKRENFRFSVSLSHTDKQATAIVIAYRG